MSTLELAQRFIDAAGAGDEAAVRNCMHPDAGIWHNYDNATQSVDENVALMQRMMLATKQRVYEVHQIEEVSNGYVQRHTLHVTSLDGAKTVSAEALSWVTVRDEKISLIEEFIDPAPLMAVLAPKAGSQS